MKVQAYIMLFGLFGFSISTMAEWKKVSSLNHPGQSYDFIDDNIGYGTTRTGFEVKFMKTVDGGTVWITIKSPSDSLSYKDMSAPADSIIYAVYRDVKSGSPNRSKIFKTINDGTTWSDITPDTTNTGMGIAAVHFVNEFVGYWVVSEKLYKTTDGGINWTSSDLPEGHYGWGANSIHFNDVNNGVIGTWDGSFAYFGGVLTTTDGGITWSDTTFSINQGQLGTVKQTSPSVAYAAPNEDGASIPLLYKTTNNGVTWSEVPIPNTLSNLKLSSFDFLDDNYGFIVEESNDTSYIYRTVNGGVSWILNQVIDANNLYVLHLTENSGYLTGGASKPFYKLDRVVGLNEVKKDYLINIYPNPTNEKLNIVFRAATRAVIKVYSRTGRLIENKEIKHNYQLKTSSYAAGIYFLKVEIDGSNKTFKFIKE